MNTHRGQFYEWKCEERVLLFYYGCKGQIEKNTANFVNFNTKKTKKQCFAEDYSKYTVTAPPI